MIGDSFGKAVDVFKRDFVGWMLLGLVLVLAGSVIPLLGGLLLLPNALREGDRAIAEERAPDVSALFDFAQVGQDLVSMLLYMSAQVLGSLLCCVGGPVAWILFWFSAEVSADGRVSSTDTLKVSYLWSKSHLGDVIGLAVLSAVLNSIGASFAIGVFFTFPFTLIAWVIYWRSVKPEVYALAIAEGVQVAPEHETFA